MTLQTPTIHTESVRSFLKYVLGCQSLIYVIPVYPNKWDQENTNRQSVMKSEKRFFLTVVTFRMLEIACSGRVSFFWWVTLENCIGVKNLNKLLNLLVFGSLG